MRDWSITTIGDHCTVTSSKRFHLSERSDEGVPFYCSKEIIQKVNGVEIEDCDYIREELYEQVKREFGVPEAGDLLITTRGTYGVPYIYQKNDRFYFADGNLTWLKDFDNDLIAEYLYYWVRSYEGQKKIDAIAKGTAQKAVPIAGIKTLQLALPPVREQKRIVNILLQYDNLIENNQKQIQLLEEVAQRLYKEWFVDLRFPGYEKTEIVDGVPEGWDEVCLDDVLQKITTGLNPRKNFVLGRGTNYYVTIKNMGDNDVYLDEKCDRVNDDAIEKINNRSDLREGDFLFSGIGTMGRVYWVCIPTDNWNVSESVFTMRANNRITNEYLYLVLLSADMQNYCIQNAHGAAQRGIRMADLRAYRFLLPSKTILDDYTYIAKPLIKKTQALRSQIKLLAEARDRLLPKLMSGEIEL